MVTVDRILILGSEETSFTVISLLLLRMSVSQQEKVKSVVLSSFDELNGRRSRMAAAVL